MALHNSVNSELKTLAANNVNQLTPVKSPSKSTTVDKQPSPGTVDTSQIEPTHGFNLENNSAIHNDSATSCGSAIDTYKCTNEQIEIKPEPSESCSKNSNEVSSGLTDPSLTETTQIVCKSDPKDDDNINQTKYTHPIKINRILTLPKDFTPLKISDDRVQNDNADESIYMNVSSGSFIVVCENKDVDPSVDQSHLNSTSTKPLDEGCTGSGKSDKFYISEGLRSSTSQSQLPFVSDNPAENQDNQDPEWEVVKKLETDEQRYRAVRKCWRTIKIPDPNKDLTYLSYRKRHLINQENKPKESTKRKRTQTSEPTCPPPKRFRSRTVSCTNILEKKIHQEEAKYNETRYALGTTYRHHLRSLSAKHADDEQKMSFEQIQCFDQMQSLTPRSYTREYWRLFQERNNLHTQQVQELNQLYQRHVNNLDREECAHRSRMNRLAEVKREAFSVNKFYQGLENNEDPTVLDYDQMKELEDIDEMFEKYNIYYNNTSY